MPICRVSAFSSISLLPMVDGLLSVVCESGRKTSGSKRSSASSVGRLVPAARNRPKTMTRIAIRRSVLLPVLVLAACIVGADLGASSPAGVDRLHVFVSVLPLKTFVEKVGGEYVQVQAMVRPGYSPHTYDPTPKQIVALSEAVLYVRTDVPFEHVWMERIRSANPKMRVLDARAGIDLRAMEAHDPGADHAGPEATSDQENERHTAVESDPHVWTSPRIVKQMAGRIRDKLIELDPRHAPDYRRNYDAFETELDLLDRDIRELLEGVRNRRFLVFHPAWGYFARDYGLIQVPIESEGKEPGPRALTALIKQAKRKRVKVIFVQPQYNPKFAVEVARAIGGRVLSIDPLSPDYSANLRRVARAIAGAPGK
jgi:zinc transport system substrate-binding protein